MLRGNLSTRPFYNERLVTMALAVVAVAVAALTLFNASRLVSLSARRNAIQAGITRDAQETARVRAETDAITKSVDRASLLRLAASTREANDLIDERMFSWTAFFSIIEKTMPDDVRLVSVSPSVEKGVFRVGMLVVARNYDAIDTFLDALQASGAFYDVVPADQQLKDDGTYGASISASYLSPTGPPTPRQAAASTTGGAHR